VFEKRKIIRHICDTKVIRELSAGIFDYINVLCKMKLNGVRKKRKVKRTSRKKTKVERVKITNMAEEY